MKLKHLIADNWFIDRTDSSEVISAKVTNSHSEFISVMHNKELLGYVNILELKDKEFKFDNIELMPPIVADRSEHLFQIISRFRESRTDVIAVVNAEGKFKGSLYLQDVLKFFADFASPDLKGSIIVFNQSFELGVLKDEKMVMIGGYFFFNRSIWVKIF